MFAPDSSGVHQWGVLNVGDWVHRYRGAGYDGVTANQRLRVQATAAPNTIDTNLYLGRVAPFNVMYPRPTHARACDPANHRCATGGGPRILPRMGTCPAERTTGMGSGLPRTPIVWVPVEHWGCQSHTMGAN